jgi:uncharacterized protein YbbK (DUF523 family)
MVVLVSACLLGLRTRYDGERMDPHPQALRLIESEMAIPICPEQLGGLPTPREPAEIVGGTGIDVLEGRGQVLTVGGLDVTAQYVAGAQEALRIARLLGAHRAVLSQNSPSCGVCGIYDGSFSHRLIEGMGVCAALLDREGIDVCGPDQTQSVPRWNQSACRGVDKT